MTAKELDMEELIAAMQQYNAAERIKSILSGIDGDSLKEMIFLNPSLLSWVLDAKSLSVILKHVDESSRLDILLYKDSVHCLFENLKYRQVADVLDFAQLIHGCLKEDEWLTLLKTPTCYRHTHLGEWRLHMSNQTRDSYKTKVGDESVGDSALLFILDTIQNKQNFSGYFKPRTNHV